MALSLLLVTALAAGAGTSVTDAVENGLLPAIAIEGVSGPMSLADRMERHDVPGVSLAVVVDGELAFAQAYGVRDDITDEPVTTDTMFQAASISKSVSAVAALRLVQSGALDLDSDVNTWLTSWRVPDSEYSTDEKVTLRRIRRVCPCPASRDTRPMRSYRRRRKSSTESSQRTRRRSASLPSRARGAATPVAGTRSCSSSWRM